MGMRSECKPNMVVSLCVLLNSIRIEAKKTFLGSQAFANYKTHIMKLACLLSDGKRADIGDNIYALANELKHDNSSPVLLAA